MSVLFPRVTIAGVGLIGGSLGLALRERGLVGEIVGYGRSFENMRDALDGKMVDRVASKPADAARDADLIVLATPVKTCMALAPELRPHAKRGAILTDVGSVKASLVAALETTWDVGPVVGGHPIAGSEKSGAKEADAKLFVRQRCILTPTARTDRAALARVRELWEAVGAVVEEMPAEEHDEILARISHLPHLVAAALVNASDAAGVAGHRVLDYAGGGFRSTTRVAGGRAELWRDIFLTNRDALERALGGLRAALARFEALLAAGDAAGLEALLEDAARLRNGLEDDS